MALLSLLFWSSVLFCWANCEEELEETIIISICQAHCLSQTLPAYNQSDSSCHANQACSTCWQMCRYGNQPNVMALFCKADPEECPTGCQAACRFDVSAVSTQPRPVVHLQAEIWRQGHEELVVRWQPVAVPALYILYWRYDQEPHWMWSLSTTATYAAMAGRHKNFSGLEFRLLAVSQSQLLAEDFPDYASAQDVTTDAYIETTERLEVTKSAYFTDVVDTTAVIEDTTTVAQQAGIHVQLTQTTTGLEAIIFIEVLGDLPSDVVVSFQQAGCDYSARGTYEQCMNTAPYTSVLQPSSHALYQYTIRGVSYNSQYWVQANVNGEKRAKKYFTTPSCMDWQDPEMAICKSSSQDDTKTFANNLQYVIFGVCVIAILLIITVIRIIIKHRRNQTELEVTKSEVIRKRSDSFRSHNSTRNISTTLFDQPSGSTHQISAELCRLHTPQAQTYLRLSDIDADFLKKRDDNILALSTSHVIDLSSIV